MRSSPAVIIARLLWFFPVLLVALTIYQADVARDIRDTLRNGQPATARVTAFESSDRVDVTYDWVSLAVTVNGRTIEHEKMSFPHTFAPLIEGKQEIEVLVQPGADQEIVISEVGRAHYRIAAINAAMSLFGALLIGIGLGAWQRLLRRKGDPAARTPEPGTEFAT